MKVQKLPEDKLLREQIELLLDLEVAVREGNDVLMKKVLVDLHANRLNRFFVEDYKNNEENAA